MVQPMRRSRRLFLIPLLAAALVLPAVAGSALAQPAPVTVQLAAQNDSGINGTATLTAMGQQTKVVVNVTGASTGPQPAHIHAGTCANLDPRPAFPLTSVANGASETTVDASLSQLQSSPMAINLHKSPQEAAVYVACGNLPAMAAAAPPAAQPAPPAAKPAAPAAAAPPAAQPSRPAAPAQLPRTGAAAFGLYGLAAVGALLALAGLGLASRRR
jgi:LPXTG-motif cell wall-anchored protein